MKHLYVSVILTALALCLSAVQSNAIENKSALPQEAGNKAKKSHKMANSDHAAKRKAAAKIKQVDIMTPRPSNS